MHRLTTGVSCRRNVPFIAPFLLLICSAGLSPAQVSNPPSVYNSIPNGLLNIPPTRPGNVISAGFEALSLREFGDGLNLAPGNRQLTTVMVVMSDWACVNGHWNNTVGTANACVTPAGSYVVEPGISVPTFSIPITLNIYATNGATPPEPGALLATTTQTFNIPYRPSASTNCPGSGRWYSTVNASCYNGLANKITFDFSSQHVTLPDQIVVGVAYNTSTAGYKPIGTGTACFATVQGCPYDSLNVSADTTAVTAAAGGGITFIGTPIDPNGVYANYLPPASNACSPASPAAAGNAFLLDTPCWTGLHPEIMVNTTFNATGEGGFLTKIFPNLGAGDSVINIGNTGASAVSAGTFGALTGGNLCVNVYVFSPDEQEVACCSCLITPNAVETISASRLIRNTLTPAVPTAVTVKLLATAGAASCNPTTAGTPASGLIAFGTNIHLAVTGGSNTAGTYAVTETPFTPSTLSTAETTRITTLCGYIAANGSGFGICPGCNVGAAGAVKQ